MTLALDTATNKAPAVTAGPWAVLDKDGNALCHARRDTRAALNSSRRRRALGIWEDALKDAGLMRGTVAYCEDGQWLDRGHGKDARDGYADAGHVVADTNDGAFCGCNFVPVEGKANRDNKDARQAIGWDAATREAYGRAFRVRALAAMTGTKRARAV